MLGRTHMAIGAAAACIAFPVVSHTGGASLFHDVVMGAPTTMMHAAELIASATIGSIAPDLDESHSLLAQKVELLGRLVLILAILVLIQSIHLHLSPLGWILCGLLTLTLLARANGARRVALLALTAGAVYAGGTGALSLAGGMGLALWCLGAAFTAHRTWTHSALGLACLIPAALWMSSHGLIDWAEGFLLGYVLHIVADSVSGGVPIFYPLGRKRLGIRLVHTGSWADHGIGAVAMVAAIVALFV